MFQVLSYELGVSSTSYILVSGNKEQLSFCLPIYAIREFFFGSVP
jgi:hypothetical protein